MSLVSVRLRIDCLILIVQVLFVDEEIEDSAGI